MANEKSHLTIYKQDIRWRGAGNMRPPTLSKNKEQKIPTQSINQPQSSSKLVEVIVQLKYRVGDVALPLNQL